MDSEEGLRLRLMTLLSLYDLLPYSISNPPHGTAPLTLEQAIGPDALRRCLDAIARQNPQSLPGELANILVSLQGLYRNSVISFRNSTEGIYKQDVDLAI